MNIKKILLLVVLFGAAVWYRDYLLTHKTVTPAPIPTSTDKQTQTVTTSSVAAEHAFTATADGQTAQALLEANATVEYKDYGTAGKFVTSIDGLAADEGHYWAFYLNGKYSETGVSQTTLKKGDIITFTYEAVDPTKF